MTFAFEFRRYRTAFKRPVRTAHGNWTHREGIIIRLSHPSGRSALGEIAPIPWFGSETIESAWEFCTAIGREFEASGVPTIPDALPCCQFAFGSALEALSEHTGVADAVRAEVACLLPAGIDVIGAAAQAVHDGFTRLKWKVGVGDTESEIAILRVIADKLPTGVLLRLDANGAWDRHDTWEWIDACEDLPIEFIEQPFPRGDDAQLLEFGTAHPGLFALDESVTPPGELWRWLEAGWPGVVIVKPSLAGDPAKLRRLLAELKADAVFSTALETTVGWHAALRFAFGSGGTRRALGFGAGAVFADDRFNPPATTPVITHAATVQTDDTWIRLSK